MKGFTQQLHDIALTGALDDDESAVLGVLQGWIAPLVAEQEGPPPRPSKK